MLKYLKKYWYWCLPAPIFIVGEITMDLVQPSMMATIVDKGVLGRNLSVILSVGSHMILLVLFGGFCGILSSVFANLAAQYFGNDLRKDLFSNIMALSFQQTDKISTGSLVTRLTNDVTQVQNMVMMSVRSVFRCSIMFAGGVFMLYRQFPKFALITACGLPFLLFFVWFFLKKATPMFGAVQQRLDGVNNVMQEDVAGARVVKAFVKEKYEVSRFDGENDSLCKVNLRVQMLLAFMSPCMNLVLNICVVAIIFVGGLTVKSAGGLTTGHIMAAITYVAQILHAILFMANIFQTFTRAKASWVRIHEVLICDNVLSDGGDKGLTEKKGEIAFHGVSFAYPDNNEQNVLENINLTVHAGETFAILGTTGSGKTSLVNLIPRFYDVAAGQVLVDGKDVRDYNLTLLRSKIAFVLQNAELYSRPIEANIRWGSKDASPFEIKEAATAAQADDFICASPDGYYTLVSEGGHSLSGGQKQRIAIARALLKKAEILILDDATSALDLKTEQKFYDALRKSHHQTTKIIIAQRIASVRTADHIAVLENGTISAIGTHDELMKCCAFYRDICRSQLREEGEPA